MVLALTVLLMLSNPEWSAFPFDGYVPEGAVGTHDPAIIDFNGHFLCFHTGPGIGFLRTSEDLMHWTTVGPVISNEPDWLKAAVPHNSVWAPEACRFGKGLRLYYCASARFGHNDSWIAVAECPNFDPTHPKEGWHDLGPLLDSKDGRDNFNAIDPDVMTDPSGRQWMYFGSYWSGLYVAELDPNTGKLKDITGANKVLIARNPSDKANGLEAPCCVYHDGFYYLFVNYGLAAQGVSSTYRIVVGRSKSPSGPFLDCQGVSMVDGGHEDVLYSSSPMFGPGGGVEFQDSKGRWLISHHYYDGRQNWHGHIWGVPTLQVRELVWSEGWPLPGLPITPETVKFGAGKQMAAVGKWLHQADFGKVQELDMRADGSCTLAGNQRGTFSQNGSQIEFRWPKVDQPGEFWLDKGELLDKGNYFVGRNQARSVIRAVRAGKG